MRAGEREAGKERESTKRGSDRGHRLPLLVNDARHMPRVAASGQGAFLLRLCERAQVQPVGAQGMGSIGTAPD